MLVKADELRTLSTRLLCASGASEGQATATADHLIESSLAGVDSHGIMRLPQYLDAMASGQIDPAANISTVLDRGAVVTLDAHWMLGPAAGDIAARLAAERVRRHGIAMIILRHAAHVGRIGAYTESLAAEGIVGLAFCNSPIHGHYVPPPAAREGRLATNPIAFAIPTANGKISADFATSTLPEGVVRLLRDRRKPAPEGALLDAAGEPTTDANAFYADPPGTILPLGGRLSGHKGFALALLVEVLAGTLAGDLTTDRALKGNNLTLIGIDPGVTSAAGAFTDLTQNLVTYIRSARPINEGDTVMVPGDKETRTRLERAQTGIPVDDFTWQQIVDRARHVGIELAPVQFTSDESKPASGYLRRHMPG